MSDTPRVLANLLKLLVMLRARRRADKGQSAVAKTKLNKLHP
jgi:hypothetical protein